MQKGGSFDENWTHFVEILFHCIDKDMSGTVSGGGETVFASFASFGGRWR